jgi:hypothetical protein
MLAPLVIGLALLAANPSAGAQSAGGSIDLAELQSLAKLSKADQLNPANQARLQQWFFEQADLYQNSVKGSAIGRSSLVNMGSPTRPPGGVYTTTFAPPSGRGRYVIFWSSNVTSPTTWSDGINLELPLGAVSINAGSDSACWHESLHAVLNPVKLSVRVEDFAPVASLSTTSDYGEAQQHVYIELVAEKAVTWLKALESYERCAIAAAEKLEDLRNHREVVNYEIENFLWAESRAAWQVRWDNSGKYIKRLPAPVKNEFEQSTATRFPTAEEVIGFYMGGDFKAPATSKIAGKEIRIPKWVMWPQAAMMPVVMAEQDVRAPELKGDTWNASFAFRLQEARLQSHPPVTRGQVIVTLRDDDPTARISVTFRGKPVVPAAPAPGSSWRRFIVKLGGTATPQDNLIGISVSVKDAPRSASARERALSVHAAYRDDFTQTNTPAQRQLYLEAEGIFLVKMPSLGKTTPVSAPPPATPAGPAATAGSTGLKPRWAQINQWSYVPRASESKTAFRWNCSITESGGSMDYSSSLYGQGKEWPFNHRLNYQWQLPAYLEPGTTVPFQIWQAASVANDQSYMLSRDVSIHVCQYDGAADPKTSQASGEFKASGVDLGSTRIAEMPNEKPAAASEPLNLKVREGRKGERMAVIVSLGANYGIRAWFYRQYEWLDGSPGSAEIQPATAAVPSPVRDPAAPASVGSIDVQKPATPPVDRALDDVPPKEHELDPWVANPPPPPPPDKPAVRWYTHPEGDYRIQLGRKWRQATTSQVEGLDELDMVPGRFMVFPKRQRTLTRTPAQNADALAAKWVAAKDKKGSRVDFKVKGESAIAVGLNNTDSTLWHLLLIRKDRYYYLSVIGPAGGDISKFPPEITDLLSGLEFLPASDAKR